MSYDFWLVDRDGVEIAGTWMNMTSNVANVWRAAGIDLAQYDGASAEDLADAVYLPAMAVTLEPSRFTSHVIGDGSWGTVNSAEKFLFHILDKCIAARETGARAVISR